MVVVVCVVFMVVMVADVGGCELVKWMWLCWVLWWVLREGVCGGCVGWVGFGWLWVLLVVVLWLDRWTSGGCYIWFGWW